ncbi:hypothetical protein BHE74_00029077 [Ensete ventricosum]|nr:hypothetical protein BHE74_00029077 [Ensete ventricosum]
MCFVSVSVEQALLVQACVRQLARGRLGAELDAGEGNPGSVIILQKRLGVGTTTVASSVGRGWPMCASSPAVVSVRSWSSVGWVEPRGLAREVGCWNGGAWVGLKYSSSGRPLTPARRSGWVGSRRDPSDSQVSSVVGFSDPPAP